jgi:hypothetical protein
VVKVKAVLTETRVWRVTVVHVSVGLNSVYLSTLQRSQLVLLEPSFLESTLTPPPPARDVDA